jgi:hypothetical protein
MDPSALSASIHDVFDQCRRIVVLLVVFTLVVSTGCMFAGWPYTVRVIGGYTFMYQDLPLAPLLFVPWLITPRRRTAIRNSDNALFRYPVAWPIVFGAGLLLFCWAGHYVIFDGYDRSRDEQMANFDAFIFAHGRLFWPIPVAWQPYAESLNLLYILPAAGHVGWVSAYLPVNAAFRALLSKVADPVLTSPLFVTAGLLALWRIGRRLWPESPESCLVALVLYVGSSQILITGMTAYAMSGHLGLNLVWLWLFLRGGKASHAGAMFIGFLATGLHQPLFHPLFVLPFLDLLRQQRRWPLLAVYLICYVAIGCFWLSWPHWMSGHVMSSALAVPRQEPVGYVARFISTPASGFLHALWFMSLNLLRFAMWQHVLLPPLMALGIGFCWRRDAFGRALTIGFCLPLVVMAFILPNEGNGWGYRYVAGVLGNTCLLGAYGWRSLELLGLTWRRMMLVGTAVSVLFVLPVHAVMAHEMILPFDEISQEMGAVQADVLIVDDDAVPISADAVLNRPDLSNRPIRLLGSELTARDVAAICKMKVVAFFDGPRLMPIPLMEHQNMPISTTAHQVILQDAARAAGCAVGH